MIEQGEHEQLVADLRAAALGTSAFSTEADRQQAIVGRGEGPVGALAHKVAEASFRVTDADIAAVRERVGSEKGAFEIVLTASIGAGLMRWDNASTAIAEAGRATP